MPASGRPRTATRRDADGHPASPAVNFADAFAVLADAGMPAAELSPRLQDMARFRNLLVHGYARVDDRRVVEILRARRGDLNAFRAALARTIGVS